MFEYLQVPFFIDFKENSLSNKRCNIQNIDFEYKDLKEIKFLFSSASSFKNEHFEGVYKQDILQNQ